jgi:hypothetical protein
MVSRSARKLLVQVNVALQEGLEIVACSGIQENRQLFAHDICAYTANNVCMAETLKVGNLLDDVFSLDAPVASNLLARKQNPPAAYFFH